jgi:outer membrane protein TolC
MRTQMAELQFNNAVVQARSRLRIAKHRLQLLMGRATPSELFDVVGDMRRDPLPFTFEELWRQALARRPDYQAMLRDQARSVSELRSQIAQGKVDYTVGTEYRGSRGWPEPATRWAFFSARHFHSLIAIRAKLRARGGSESRSRPAPARSKPGCATNSTRPGRRTTRHARC